MIDARTLWAAYAEWARRQMKPDTDQMNRGALAGLVVYIYPKGRAGAYRMHNPKLYWDEDTTDGHFQNTDDELPEPEEVSHVVGACPTVYNLRGIDRYWRSWAEFAAEIGLPEAPGE